MQLPGHGITTRYGCVMGKATVTPLTEEEKALVKLAYMLGRNHTFDAAPAVRKKESAK